MSKILYLSYDGMTDALGSSQVIPYLKGLAKKGHEIHLLSFEKKENKKEQQKTAAILTSNNIVWHPLSYTKKPAVFATLWDVYQLRRKVIELQHLHNFDIVHCRSYITALAGQFLKKKYALKFIFDMRGFWADERVDGNLWRLDNLLFKRIYQYFKKKELEFLAEADYTISLTYEGKEVIGQWEKQCNKPFAPVQVIPCCVDLELFDPEKVAGSQKQSWRTALGLGQQEFVLAYLGSLGTWYKLPEMLDFFKVLVNRLPQARFLFITAEAPRMIYQLANEKGIDPEKLVVKKAKRDEVPALLSLADLSIFFIKPAFSKKASSPTKQGEIMAMGIPLVCNNNVGDTEKIVRDYQAGGIIEHFETSAYQKVVDQILNSSLPFDRMKTKQGAEEYFSLQQGVEKYHEIYTVLLAEQANAYC